MERKKRQEKPAVNGFVFLIERIHVLASSAAVERPFTGFGLVHTKIRNRLENDKAANLVKCYSMLRSNRHDGESYIAERYVCDVAWAVIPPQLSSAL